jgi:hypothetical protein|tara:strand:- start:371 stop:655 length:285 start_codon:yes stop_codon:yes gene_type:complete
MRIKGAMTILHKRADYFGVTFRELIDMYESDSPMKIENETARHIEAYEVYKRDQGFVWSGLLGYKWVTVEQSFAIYKIWRGEGYQLDLFKESII